MPVIRIEYDDTIVSDDQAHALAVATQREVAEETGIKDVFVYGNASKIRVGVAPIEIWVEVTASKISNADDTLASLRQRLGGWKVTADFPHPINLTLNLMNWKFAIGI